MAGNVGRTGSSKINQDSVFVSKISADGRALVTKEQLKSGPQECDWFCSVADGHGANGHFVSQFIAQHMPKQYEVEKRKIDRHKQAKEMINGYKNGKGSDAEPHSSGSASNKQQPIESEDRRIKKSLVQSFLQVQSKLESQKGFDCDLSGSTVVAVYFKENTFYFANAGDSRGIIIGETKNYGQEYMHERGGDGTQDLQIMILS